MKICKITLAALVTFGFLAIGCAENNNAAPEQATKETSKNAHHSYSSKLGTQSTKKDIKK